MTGPILRKMYPGMYRPESNGAVSRRTITRTGNQTRMQATRTSQDQSETIDCQRRDMLLYSGLKEQRISWTFDRHRGRLTLARPGCKGQECRFLANRHDHRRADD